MRFAATILPSVLAAAALALSGDSGRPPVSAVVPGPEPVQLTTADGVTIHGWYMAAGDHAHEHGEKPPEREHYAATPAVVMLHMFRSDKSSWQSLMEHCRLAGVATLAIDMRGHGQSKLDAEGKDLTKLVQQRDEELFQAMWQDAQAAVDFLTERGHELPHIGLIGASVGCSVAIDCARRNPGLRTVAVLTPGRNYLGLPSMEHLKQWGDRDLLLVSSEDEQGKGAGPMRTALLKQSAARVETWLLPDSSIHGTQMFGPVRGIEQRLMYWFLGRLWPQPHLPWFETMRRD